MRKLARTSRKLTVEVPVMAKIWNEDNVWNVSAFDLPVVVFADTLPEAQVAFEDALTSHFLVLGELGLLRETLDKLAGLERERNFWQDRLRPRETVQRFIYSSVPPPEICASAMGSERY